MEFIETLVATFYIQTILGELGYARLYGVRISTIIVRQMGISAK